MNEQFEFRIVLIKIQDSLSDEDRAKLNFLFGEEIPRRLQDNSSLENALQVLQTLFDHLKITPNNYDYLVRALHEIGRQDCAERLRDYQKLVPPEIIPPLPDEPRQTQVALASTPQGLSLQYILADLTEDDAVIPTKTNEEPIKFNPPEPDPMDFNSIDLTPFEDPSVPWTAEYSNLLQLKNHPRDYQIEIIRDAVRSGNTIVCLRTGSGKTFIASILIKYHYIKQQKTNPGSAFFTLFFVPRKAIRLQQAKAISGVGNLKVQICEDDQTIDKLIGTNHVVVSTPQKFVNCLKNGKLFLAQINLMIFDECHNTSGANPYCEILKFYLCPSRKQNTGDKPLIIGLTATVSAKDAVEKKDTIRNNLVALCSKLSCQTISTVCDPNNIIEINRKISRPLNDQFQFVLKVKYNSHFDEYKKMFDDLITQIKQHLDGHEVLDGHEIGSSSFIGQLVFLKQSFEKKGQINNIVICDYLSFLTKKYSALKDLPFDMVIKHMIQKIHEYHQSFQEPVPMDNLLYERCATELEAIVEKHKEHPTTNSKLDDLVKLLRQHAQGGTKGLVLVQTTFYAKTLYDFLHNHSELTNIVKPTWLVGQNGSDYSLTIHEQEAKLRQFSGDECNVLIATDIVQEGLDIPTCSYVIRYEFVSDEIGTIQSRGRARAQNSSYYLITEHGSINHRREQNNKIREDTMEIAITEWPNIDKDKFREDVKTNTDKQIGNWEKAITEEMQQKALVKNIGKKTGLICCRKCGRQLGRLEWLRKRNTFYFVNNQEFFTNNECRLDSQYKNFQENLVMGEVKCTCGNSLGGCQKFTDRLEIGTLCALKCTQIKIKIDDENNSPFILLPQWSKNNYFEVEELDEI